MDGCVYQFGERGGGKQGSEAYDVSKAALSHLIRELAVKLAPDVRVNGISPATVVKGSNMFPARARDCVADQVRYSVSGVVQHGGAAGRLAHLCGAHADAEGD